MIPIYLNKYMIKVHHKKKDKIDKMNEKQLYVFMGKLWSKFGRQVRLT